MNRFWKNSPIRNNSRGDSQWDRNRKRSWGLALFLTLASATVGEDSAVANDAVQEASIHLETAKKLNTQNRFVEAEASCRHAVELLEGAANESWLARFAEAENWIRLFLFRPGPE